MATGFGTGFDINALDAAIKKAEQGIDRLVSRGTSMESSITNNFKNIAKNGVGDFINKLNEAKQVISSLGISSGGKSGIANIVDDVNRLTQSLGKTSSSNGLETIDKAMQSLMERIKMLSGEIKTFKSFEGGNLLNTEDYRRIGEVSDQLNILMKQYEALHNTRLKLQQQGDLFKDHIDNINGVSVSARKQKSELDKLNQAYKTGTSELHKKAKAEDDATKNAIAKTRKLTEEYERQAKAKREAEYKKNTSYQGAIDFSSMANSINREMLAIKYLTEARRNLSKADSDYQNKLNTLNDKIKAHILSIKEAVKGSKELREKHRSLMDTSGQLARALAGVFSVSAIKNYITKIVDVRGEFELQHRSLQAIIQDVDKANKLWDKTIALAVKSPFRVKELVTYTKQLAAYRVETDKLYDTTRMLADVSAGLGVDMNRLILAYGQVKAATFLRGTELRQFTEAGIPMLDELAKYFTELENRFVSAADVFDRISKRGVTFEDVDVVFKKITGEDGVFYKMQEKQAETLKGMINNLRDSIDLMLNEIGTSQEESLKGVISATKDIVENWRAVAVVIKQVGFVAVISALRNLVMGWNAVTLSTFEGTAAMTGASKAGATLRLSLQKLYDTMKANPWAFIIGGIVAAGHAMWNYKKAIEEVNKKYDELSVSEIKKIDNLNASLDKVNDSVEKNNSVLKNSKSTEEELASARESNLRILNQLKTEYPDVFKVIVQQKDGTIQLSNAVEEQNRKLRANIALQQEAKAKWYRESQGENYKDVIEAQGNLQSQIDKTKVGAYQLGVKIEEAIRKGKITRDDAKPLLDYMEEIKKANNATDILRKGIAITSFNDKAGKAVDFYKFREKHLKELEKMRVRYEGALSNFGVNLDEQMATFKIEMAEMETELERGEWLKAQLENLGILNSEIQNWAKDYISKKINLDIVFPNPAKEVKYLEAWQNTYNKKFGDKDETKEIDPHKGFVKIQNKNTKQSAVVERLQAEYKETKELIERIEAAGGEAATAAGGAYEGLNVGKLTAELNQIQEQIEWFGAPLEKKQKKSIEILNRRISLIKEMYEEYNKVHKETTASEAERDVANAYRDTFIEAFEGTGIDFSKLVINKEELNNLIEAGDEAGSAFSDAMLAKIKKIEDAGTYIRNFTEELVSFTQNNEKFIPYAYYDQDKWVNGKPPKASESTTKKGTLTIGTGITNNSGIDYKFDENATLTEAKNQELLNKILETKAQRLNKILDKNKELILTQEQYNMLLDQFYQGEAGTEKAINIAQGDWEGFEKYLNTIKNYKQLNKKHVVVDVDAIKEEWDALDTLQEKLALVMKWTNITTKQTKEVDGKKVTERFISSAMQERSIARSQVFSGDLEVVKLLQKSAIDVSQIDFTNIEGVIEILKKLKPIAEKEGKEAELALSRAISEFEAELNIKPKIEERESIERSIDELFGNYEISLEMDKLNIPKDLAKRLFGLEAIDLKELKPAILEKFGMQGMRGMSNAQIYESKAFKSMSEARRKELKEALDKEAKMEEDARMDRLKTYSKYLVKEQHERIRLKIDEIRKIAEIESMSEFTEDEKEAMKENVRRETNEKMAKSYWEDFEKSPMFVNLFDDMELATKKSLVNMKKHLESMRDSMMAAGLPASDLKEILDKINQVEKELEERNPFSNLKSIGAVMFGTGGEETISRKEFKLAKQDEDTYLKNAKALAEQEQAALSLVESKKRELDSARDILSTFEKGTDEYRIQEQEVNNLNTEYSGLVKSHSDAVKKTEENNQKLNQAQSTTKQWKEQVKDVGDAFVFVQNAVNQIGGALSTALQQTGLMGEEDAAIFDSAMNVANSALGLGASIASGDIVGIITNGLSLIGNIAATGDAVRQKAINAELEKAKNAEKIYENLEKKYAKLQKTMEKAIDISTMDKTKKEMEGNIDAQNSAIDEQIKALERANAIESENKKVDQAAIDANNQKIEELKAQKEELADKQEELNQQFIETLGGSYDYTSAAEQFLDAWITAFEETGDGMKGLEDSFDDFWKSVLKKQVVYGGASEIIKSYMDKINDSLSDGTLDDMEIKDIEEKEEKTKQKLNDFYKWANEKYGLAEFDSEADTLSGLQAGIQGITDEQANILEAYWNAVRFSAASIDAKMDRTIALTETLLRDVAENSTENPIVGQLKLIQMNTRDILTILQNVTNSSSDVYFNIRT